MDPGAESDRNPQVLRLIVAAAAAAATVECHRAAGLVATADAHQEECPPPR